MTKNWEKYREVILDLYMRQGKTLSDTMALMEEHHGFKASTRAYRSRLKRWDVGRYSKPRRESTPSGSGHLRPDTTVEKPMIPSSSGTGDFRSTTPDLETSPWRPTGLPLISEEPFDGRQNRNTRGLRSLIVHELAVKPMSFEELRSKWQGHPYDLRPALDAVADFDDNLRKHVLKRGSWKELDVFTYDYDSYEDRPKAIDNAVRAYDRMRVGSSDPVWDRLLPKEERGQGRTLSKLLPNMSRGPPQPRERTPQIDVESTTAGSDSGSELIQPIDDSEGDGNGSARPGSPDNSTQTRTRTLGLDESPSSPVQHGVSKLQDSGPVSFKYFWVRTTGRDVKGTRVVVDSGSSENLISASEVCRLGLQTKPIFHPGISINTLPGQLFVSNEYVDVSWISLGREIYGTDRFYMVPLEAPVQMVVGSGFISEHPGVFMDEKPRNGLQILRGAFDARLREAQSMQPQLKAPSSTHDSTSLGRPIEEMSSMDRYQPPTASYSASRPSGGTQKTYTSTGDPHDVSTEGTEHSRDEPACGIPQATGPQRQLGLYTTRTEYSVSDGSDLPASRDERYISDLAADLFEAVKPHHSDVETLERLSEQLPALLRTFAVKVGHQAQTQTHLDVSYFVQKHRRKIQSSFQQEFLPRKDTTQADGIHNGEFSIARFLEDHTAEFEDIPDDNLPASPADVGHPDIDNARSEQEAGRYRDFILETSEYQWLIGSLQRESTLRRASPVDAMETIRTGVLAALPSSHHHVSRSAPSRRCRVTLELGWDPLAFVDEQSYSEAPGDALERAVTITGTADDAQAVTAGEYLVQTWATGGRIMQLVKEVARRGRHNSVSCVLPDRTELDVRIDDEAFIVHATGPSDSVVEVGQQFAWLGAALRSSTSRNGIAQCTPFVSSAALKTLETQSSGLEPIIPELICGIGFDIQPPDVEGTDAPGKCWHNMFRNPVMVVGFPIPFKPESDLRLGLEMPLNMISVLAGSERVHEFDGKVFIKGYSTMVVATKIVGDLVIWHYFYNAERKKISHLDHTLDDELNGTVGLSQLENARHVVGWCSQCKSYAGTADARKDVKRARDLPLPSSGCRLEKISLSGGKIITAGASFAIATKDTPAHLTIKGYIEKLMSIDEKRVVLWDEADKRGWLVSGTSALLHLVRASLHHRSRNKFSAAFRWRQGDMNESESAVDVLINEENRELELYADKPTVSEEDEVRREDVDDAKGAKSKKRKWDYYTFQDLVEQHYHYLDQIMDYQARAEGRDGIELRVDFRTRLEGWDFVELATATSTQISPRVATLQAFGWGWVDFVRSIGAVALFGCGFGELIRPEVFEGMCPNWQSLPKNKYYLAAGGLDLESVKLDPGRLVWHSPAEPVAPCQCQGRSALKSTFGSSGHHDPVQVFYPKRSRHVLPINRPVTIHSGGAYVFGHNVTWRYRWKAGKDEGGEDLEVEGDPISSVPRVERTSHHSAETDSRSSQATGWPTVAHSSQSHGSATDAATPSSLPSGPSTTLLSQPSASSTVEASVESVSHLRPLPHRSFSSKRSSPPEPSFDGEAGRRDEEHGQERRTKRRKQREADGRA